MKRTTNDFALASITKRCDVGIKKMRFNEVLERKSAIKVWYYLNTIVLITVLPWLSDTLGIKTSLDNQKSG